MSDPRDIPPDRQVGLIHGLGRGPGSMLLMANRLQAAGFTCFTLNYRSRHVVPGEAMADLDAQIARAAPAGCHLVGHSLGGVLSLRLKLADPARIHRVVQLGSPNLGSPMAAFLSDVKMVANLMGPALHRIAAADMGLSELPREVARDLGIIAGSAPVDRLSALWGIEEPSDGMVPLSSALGVDHADALITNTIHGMLPLSLEAARQVGAFLERGAFAKERA
ncbi:esterase/lipase family protein [Roseobacter sp. HKCCA0434]|uniref:esterase/lipase family protein n=1 Tax=Roseobacter sp. HKCCA0434 TaxID=3079297 RepID=UPI002905C715|nr:alpha/beta fold hydrolase [Roseobacter sp. HKCCA0434]